MYFVHFFLCVCVRVQLFESEPTLLKHWIVSLILNMCCELSHILCHMKMPFHLTLKKRYRCGLACYTCRSALASRYRYITYMHKLDRFLWRLF